MLKQFAKWNGLMLLALAVFFTSCNKEETDSLTETVIETRDGDGYEQFGEHAPEGLHQGPRCFTLVFPVTLEYPNGDAVTVEDGPTLRQLLQEWRQANPGVQLCPRLALPYEVITEDGETLTIDSPQARRNLIRECRDGPQHRPRRCFRFVYPVTLNYPDGHTAEASNPQELMQLMKEWREANPGSEEHPTIALPVDVQLKNGNVITIETEEDFAVLRERCGPDGPPRRCFRIVFPVTLNFPDGTTAEATDPESMKNLIQEWRDANPDSEERPQIDMPFDVELVNGETLTIETEEDLAALRARCGPDGPPRRCFRIVFPVTLEFPDGTTAEAATPMAMQRLMRQWRQHNPQAEERPHIAFPHEVQMEDGTVVTVHSPEEVRELRATCN